MDFDDTPQEAEFRAKVRAFLSANAARRKPGTAEGYRTSQSAPGAIERAKAWQAKKYEAGYAGITWPKEWGGRGGTPIEQVIYYQEEARYLVPRGFFEIGLGMCIPTLCHWGTSEQRQRYAAPALKGDDIWCQLFSEPAAGSDLAGLRTRAVRDGDDWRINGQKVWTTQAHMADYGILLTRTDPEQPKHRGLTMFVVDMHAPGVTVRPLRQMSGHADFNEVFFDDVVIPDSERLGPVDGGWTVALTTLMSERLSIGGAGTDVGAGIDSVLEHVRKHIGALSEDRQALVRQEFGRQYVASMAIRYTGYRQL